MRWCATKGRNEWFNFSSRPVKTSVHYRSRRYMCCGAGHFENKRRIFSLSDRGGGHSQRSLLLRATVQLSHCCMVNIRKCAVCQRFGPWESLKGPSSRTQVLSVCTCDLWRFPDGHKDRVTTTAQPSCTRRPYKFTPKTSLGHLCAIASSNLGLNSSLSIKLRFNDFRLRETHLWIMAARFCAQ